MTLALRPPKSIAILIAAIALIPTGQAAAQKNIFTEGPAVPQGHPAEWVGDWEIEYCPHPGEGGCWHQDGSFALEMHLKADGVYIIFAKPTEREEATRTLERTVRQTVKTPAKVYDAGRWTVRREGTDLVFCLRSSGGRPLSRMFAKARADGECATLSPYRGNEGFEFYTNNKNPLAGDYGSVVFWRENPPEGGWKATVP